MNYMYASLLVFILNTLLACGNELARGFNEDIDWMNLEDGLELAKKSQKPIMMLVHKTWCGACKALKPKFSADKEIEDLSKDFVMINVQDDEEPKDSQFAPDGGYIPRILFMHSNGKVKEELVNANGNQQYKYFYPECAHIKQSMKQAKELLGRAGDEL